MKRVLIAFACLILWQGVSAAQKGKAGSDYYPMGYPGDTWTGEVTAFDNEQRTLTLTHGSGKDAETFVASIPDAPYEWATDKRKNRVIDFPYDKKAKYQMFHFVGPGFAANLLPESGPDGRDAEMFKRPNPPDTDRIVDFSEFKGRRVSVYYTVREREVNGKKLKYNDVWRILVLPAGKK